MSIAWQQSLEDANLAAPSPRRNEALCAPVTFWPVGSIEVLIELPQVHNMLTRINELNPTIYTLPNRPATRIVEPMDTTKKR